MKHLIQTDGTQSGTKTWATIFVIITAIRYALSGITIGDFSFPEFNAGEVLPMIGAMFNYTYRRYTDKKTIDV